MTARGRARAPEREIPGTWEWLAASHDAYRRLPGAPIHHRLVAVGEPGVLVLDAVVGTGHHRLESHLHQHPSQAPSGPRIAALGAAVQLGVAPLHERFGETRPLRRHRVVYEGALPWAGGWWIGREAGRDADALPAPTLSAGTLRTALPGLGLALEWRIDSADAWDAVSLWAAEAGSAT